MLEFFGTTACMLNIHGETETVRLQKDNPLITDNQKFNIPWFLSKFIIATTIISSYCLLKEKTNQITLK